MSFLDRVTRSSSSSDEGAIVKKGKKQHCKSGDEDSDIVEVKESPLAKVKKQQASVERNEKFKSLQVKKVVHLKVNLRLCLLLQTVLTMMTRTLRRSPKKSKTTLNIK